MCNMIVRIKWQGTGKVLHASGQVAGRFTITAILGDAPRSMMDWKYSIISGASLQCLSRIFFLGRKPIFPQELRHFNLPRRAENGITIEARTSERWQASRSHPRVAERLRARANSRRARRGKPVYWLDAGRPMPYKLGRTEKQISK